MWGADLTISLNFNQENEGNLFGLSTSSGNDASTETSKTYGGYTYKLKATNSCYYYSGNVSGTTYKCLLMGKTNSYIVFPAISDKKLTKVTIGISIGSSTATVAICEGNTSTITTGGEGYNSWAKGETHSWTLENTSANTAYSARVTSNHNIQITTIELEYTNVGGGGGSKYTVSFNTGMGNPSQADITEASAGAGITLPDGPTPACSDDGWVFVGWAESSCSETTTAPELLAAGDEITPESDMTLYAVYRKLTSGTSTATFNAADISNLTEHSIYNLDWRDNTGGIELYISDGQHYTGGSSKTWTVTNGTSNYALVDAHTKISLISITISGNNYKVGSVDKDAGTAKLSTSGTSQTVTCSGDVTKVYLCATSNNQIRMTTFTVTYYNAKFDSNPTCQACVAPDHVDISGRWDRFGGETINLTAAAYASAGTGSPIADGAITGWQWEKLVGSTWTPLSNGTADGVTISGATTKNLQIANCNGDNSGKYRCVVSTGATCSTASNGFQVKVYVLECYTDGTTTYNFTRTGDTQAGTCQINLAAGNHAFKFHADNDYYGNNGTINEDVSNWVCSTSQGNLTIAAGLGGTFTINMEYSTSGSSSALGEPEISVTYPRKTIYLTPGVWNTGGAKFAIYYFRKVGETTYGYGWTDFITANDCGSSADIPQWNGVKMDVVRLKNTCTSPNWSDKWAQTNDITVSSNDYVTITGWNESDYTYTTYSTPTYTISYAAGTGGSGTRESETKTCGVDFVLPNSAVFTRTGYKQTGWATSDGGSNAYDLGESYTTNAAQTFYPFWTEATYTVTLTTNGGTINAGNVTSYVYGTGATLPTNVTKDHATFQGWYASSTFEGERVYSIGASEFGDKTYYAKWEAITYTVTWKANGSIVRTDSNVAEGGKVASVPSAPADLTTDPNGCDAEFAGWVIETNDPGPLSISTRTTAPTGMFTDVAGSPTITGNVTFVAIYRQEQ